MGRCNIYKNVQQTCGDFEEAVIFFKFEDHGHSEIQYKYYAKSIKSLTRFLFKYSHLSFYLTVTW